MSSGNRGDRVAPIFLGLLATTIIIVAFLGLLSRYEAEQQKCREIYAATYSQQERGNYSTCANDHIFFGDGYAQWLMVIFSVLATGTSVWAVLLLRDTLKETRNAVKSADDAVDVTRSMGQAQVRAYLEFKIQRVVVTELDAVNGPSCKVAFIGKIYNSGQSPAYAFTILYDIEAAETHPVKGYSADGSDFHEQKAAAMTIASKGHINKSIAKNISASREDIVSEKLTVRLTYLIKYTDVFDEKITGFICSGTIGRSPDGVSLRFNPGHIEPNE